MEKKDFFVIIVSIEEDLKFTSKELKKGKPYQLYFNELLDTKYKFMQYLNEHENMSFDIELIKKQDRQKYSI